MKTYMIFIYGAFEDHADIEFFCVNILGESPVVNSLKYVIENSKNIIVIFDSDLPQKEISKTLRELIVSDNVAFYFIFERDSIISSYLPIEVKDFIFKPTNSISAIEVQFERVKHDDYDLDEILEKIKTFGLSSLTPEEKKFLNDFEK